jgi:hypothetical protein
MIPFLNILDLSFGCLFFRCSLSAAQIASKLDEHMGVLVEGLNSSLVSCASLGHA